VPLKKENLTTIVLLSACIFVSITLILFEIFPATLIASFASFLSAAGTTGILILTAVYVVFSNRQITELKKQRELQLQPLPNIRVTEAAIVRPILLVGPSSGSIAPAVPIYFKCKIDNIGNASAVMVDTIFQLNGRALNRTYDEFWARRFHAINEKEHICFIEHLREHSTELLHAINTSLFADGCPKSNFFSILLNIKILYRNILGTPFLLTVDNVIRVNKKNEKTIAQWIGIMESFESEYAEELATFKAVFQRSRNDADEILEEIKKSFKQKLTIEAVPIGVLPWAASFKVKHLENYELNELEKKINHSLPINIASDSVAVKDDSDFKKYISEDLSNH
jgi:hypothetical protein